MKCRKRRKTISAGVSIDPDLYATVIRDRVAPNNEMNFSRYVRELISKDLTGAGRLK
jgi:hypothetical protein